MIVALGVSVVVMVVSGRGGSGRGWIVAVGKW